MKIIEKNRNTKFQYINNFNNADIVFDHKNENSETFSRKFYNMLSDDSIRLNHEDIFPHYLMIKDEKNNNDVISTIFYLINCLQEFNSSAKDQDKFGRFKFTSSYQYKFQNIHENIVEGLIRKFCKKYSIQGNKKESRFFISHDIDKIYGSLLEDGYWSFKRMDFKSMINIIVYEISNKPHWKNIDKILSINNKHDIVSTFFWLVNNGIGKDGVNNADYKIRKEVTLLNAVTKNNGINGLHKSSSDMRFDEEIKKGKNISPFNRYHYLKFSCQKDWERVSNSSIIFDSSLGFAEHYGFRNSYGKSFQPFNLKRGKPYDFIETPLNFMDTTFDKYMDISVNGISEIIIKFFEENPKNCDLSLLWHNTYFTNFKYNSFIDEYKKIISYVYDKKIKCVTPKELVKENKLDWA